MMTIKTKTKGLGLPFSNPTPFGICSMDVEADAGAGGAAAPAAGADTAADAGAAAEAPAAAEQVTSLAGGAGAEGKAAAEGGEAAAGAAGEGEADAGKAKAEGEEGGEGKAKIETLGAPEKYELKAPEGMEFDTAAFEAVEPILRELDLSGEAAQALVSGYAEKIIPILTERLGAQMQDKAEADNLEFRKNLEAEARADPIIGGAKFDETIDLVATTWERFGVKPGTGVRKLLDDTGLGNHKDLLLFLARVGKATGEGSFVQADGHGGGERKSDTDVFYGGDKAKA